ncbi:hypothetical protein B0H34DRAFT_799880 [Crassisporium funariophilum]|nr:hypothetical protein B0H34DRAFT_799880 [Crassisporium funariophilum]
MTNHTTQSPLPILNPNVYLNYLPRDVAAQYEAARNVALASLGALLWDIMVTLPADWKLMRSGFRYTLIPYFLTRYILGKLFVFHTKWISQARPFSLASVLLAVFSKTHPTAHCAALEIGETICLVLANASSSFLLSRRVQAVYPSHKTIRSLFLILLVVSIGVSMTLPFGFREMSFAKSGYCITTGITSYAITVPFARLFFDTCVYMGIAYQVLRMEGLSGECCTWRTIVTGKCLSRLARAFLLGGQQYYLITVSSNISIAVMIVAPSMPRLYTSTFAVLDIALTASMACRVFRNLKIAADTIDTAMSSMLFKRPLSDYDRQITGSIGARLHSNPSTLHISPAGIHLKSISTPSLRVHDLVQRSSIINIRPTAAVPNQAPSTLLFDNC